MTKILVFDMDGTIADLYGVKNWLHMLQTEKSEPYTLAKPIYNPDVLNSLLGILKAQGWKIIVTTWLSKDSSDAYAEAVKTAKLNWLKKVQFPYDEINLVAYGTKKTSCTEKYHGYQILIDDNADVRKEWTLGATIDANHNILADLVTLICAE